MGKKWKHLIVLISKNDNVIRVDNIEISSIPWTEYIKTLGDLGWEMVGTPELFGDEGRKRAYFKCPAKNK